MSQPHNGAGSTQITDSSAGLLNANSINNNPPRTPKHSTDPFLGGVCCTHPSGHPMSPSSAPPSLIPATEGKASSSSYVFVRHQFIKGHRATPTAPRAIFIDDSHKDSHEAADYAHERASYLLERESRLESENKAENCAPSTNQHQQQAGDVDERARLLTGDGAAAGGTNNGSDGSSSQRSHLKVDLGDDDNASIVGGGDGGGATDSFRRFASYFFVPKGDANASSKRSLTALTLMGIMFCNCIGGGYGLENSIGSGGALITILGIVILPFLWAVPVAFVVAELATSVPSNGGYLMWINISMPSPVYFFAVICTLLLMFIDNAVYPVLFADYLCKAVDCSSAMYTSMKVVVLAATCFMNLLGVEAVGWMTLVITVMSIAPFALMFVIHMIKTNGYINWDNLSSVPPDIDWVGLVATIAWNVAGLEQAGSVAEDVKDPQRNFVRAVIPLIGLVWLSYIPPIVAGVSRSHNPEDWSLWDNGYFATVSEQIAGGGFKIFTVVGGLFSAFGLLMSCLCLSSRTLAGTGGAAAFPRPISKVIYSYNKRFGTPHWSILINTFFTGLCAVALDFSALVAIDQALYGIRLLLIFMACIKLRYAYPHLERPFKIPGSADRLVALLTVPMLISLALTILCAMVDVPTAITFASVVAAAAVVGYLYCRFFRPHGFDGKILRVYAVEGLMGVPAEDRDAIIEYMAGRVHGNSTGMTTAAKDGCTE